MVFLCAWLCSTCLVHNGEMITIFVVFKLEWGNEYYIIKADMNTK